MDEYGWIIEAGSDVYWNGRTADQQAFTPDANNAIRFSRFQDADYVRLWLLGDMAIGLKSTQHKFCQNPKNNHNREGA